MKEGTKANTKTTTFRCRYSIVWSSYVVFFGQSSQFSAPKHLSPMTGQQTERTAFFSFGTSSFVQLSQLSVFVYTIIIEVKVP